MSDFRNTISLDRPNSFVRRTVSRTVNNATITHQNVKDSDFINVITAIEELYAQPDVMEMQQLDGRKREQVGQGGVFCVSTVNAESTRPSQTAADTIIRHTQDVIVKQLPAKLFDENGLALAGSHGAAAKFVMELRILSNPILRSNQSIIRLLGIGWEYTRSVSSIFHSLFERRWHHLGDKPGLDIALLNRRNTQRLQEEDRFVQHSKA